MLEIVIELVIEIRMEQTWLFQCILFHYNDRLMTFVIEIAIDFSYRAILILKNFE